MTFFRVGDPVHHRLSPTQMQGRITALITSRRGTQLYRVRWSPSQSDLRTMADLAYGHPSRPYCWETLNG
jgi:hypothetical protein